MHVTNEIIFFVPFSVIIIGVWVYSYKTGKKVLLIFPSVNSVKVIYRCKFASGYSGKSFLTKLNILPFMLDIVVTEEDLWIRARLLNADKVAHCGMIHKIPFDAIVKTERKGRKVIVDFVGEQYEMKQIVLWARDPNAFLQALGNKKGVST